MAAAEVAPRRPTLAVFASDEGPGDAERASLMSLAGTMIARHRARIVCMAHGAKVPLPLVTSARTAGGEVVIVGSDAVLLPGSLAIVPVERLPDDDARYRRVAELADAFVGLPGSLASAADLYKTWVRAGGGASGKPVVLLNRNRAFEPLRGMAQDVLAHSVKRHDRMVVSTDSPEDLWHRIAWALEETGHPAG